MPRTKVKMPAPASDADNNDFTTRYGMAMVLEMKRRLEGKLKSNGRHGICPCAVATDDDTRRNTCDMATNEARTKINRTRWDQAVAAVAEDERPDTRKTWACTCGTISPTKDARATHMATVHTKGIHGPHVGGEGWAATSGASVAYLAHPDGRRQILNSRANILGMKTKARSTAEAEGDQTAIGIRMVVNTVGARVGRIIAVSDAKSMVDLYDATEKRHMKIRQRVTRTLAPCIATVGAVAEDSTVSGFDMRWDSNEHDRKMSDATRLQTNTRLNKAVDIASKHVSKNHMADIREGKDARTMPQPAGYGLLSDFSMNGMRIGERVNDIATTVAAQTHQNQLRRMPSSTRQARAARAVATGRVHSEGTDRARQLMPLSIILSICLIIHSVAAAILLPYDAFLNIPSIVSNDNNVSSFVSIVLNKFIKRGQYLSKALSSIGRTWHPFTDLICMLLELGLHE